MKPNTYFEDEFNATMSATGMSIIDAKLLEVTEEQRARFHLLYPNGVPEERRAWAYSQICRTIEKNNAKQLAGMEKE